MTVFVPYFGKGMKNKQKIMKLFVYANFLCILAQGMAESKLQSVVRLFLFKSIKQQRALT